MRWLVTRTDQGKKKKKENSNMSLLFAIPFEGTAKAPQLFVMYAHT